MRGASRVRSCITTTVFKRFFCLISSHWYSNIHFLSPCTRRLTTEQWPILILWRVRRVDAASDPPDTLISRVQSRSPFRVRTPPTITRYCTQLCVALVCNTYPNNNLCSRRKTVVNNNYYYYNYAREIHTVRPSALGRSPIIVTRVHRFSEFSFLNARQRRFGGPVSFDAARPFFSSDSVSSLSLALIPPKIIVWTEIILYLKNR